MNERHLKCLESSKSFSAGALRPADPVGELTILSGKSPSRLGREYSHPHSPPSRRLELAPHFSNQGYAAAYIPNI